MKSKTIGYTTQKLNRESAPAPTFASTTKQVWKRIKSFGTMFNNNQTIKLFFTNGRKYQNEKNLTEWAKDYSRNRQMQRIHDVFGNPNPHQENTQQNINDIKFGRL